MTSSLSETAEEPTNEPAREEFKGTPAGVRSRADFWKMSGLICLSSLLVSVYAMFLSDRLAPAATQSDVDQTALVLGRELSEIYLSHRRFGRVGLIDISSERAQQIGLNTLQATLRLDQLIFSRLHLDYVCKLIENDARDAAWLTRELASIEHEQVSASGNGADGGRIFELARKMLARNWRAGELVNLKISLGRLKPGLPSSINSVGTRTKLPSISDDFPENIADNNPTGLEQSKNENNANRPSRSEKNQNSSKKQILSDLNYRAHEPVRIGDNKYEFIEVADEMRFCPVSNFEPVPENLPASVLLLEATFDAKERDGRAHKVRKLSSCVVLGAAVPVVPASVFMLSFPHGYFANFPNLDSIFKERVWLNSGDSYEAYGGSVPGSGRLIPTTIANGNMAPSQAVMQAFYHFLFALGPEINANNVQQMIALPLDTAIEQWRRQSESLSLSTESAPKASVYGEQTVNNSTSGLNPNPTSSYIGTESSPDQSSAFNAGLFRNTGAAKFALAKQSTEGGIGQKVVLEGFTAKPFSQQAPSSTFPLSVNPSGFVSLSNGSNFQIDLIVDFFNDLYRTNIAGIETMQVADRVKTQTEAAIQQCLREIAALREEKNSIRMSILKVSALPNKDEVEDKLPQLEDRSIILDLEIEKLNERKEQLGRLSSNASFIAQNGRQAAKTSYEIASHMDSFVDKGLAKVTAPLKGYLLNRSVAFFPITVAVTEEDIYDIAENLPMTQKKGQIVWTTQQFKITDIAENNLEVDGEPIIDYWQMKTRVSQNEPVFVMFSSRDLHSKAVPRLRIAAKTPFPNSGITHSQFFYFAPGCLQSLISPGVSLSVLIRDLQVVRRKGIGEALISSKPRWCLDMEMESDQCPGLSAEIQIRTPLPQAINFPSRYLQDPAGGPAMPLVPPLPAEML